MDARPPATLRVKFRSSFGYRVTGNIIVALVTLAFLVWPGISVVRDLCDPALRRPGIPRVAWRMHRYLTPRIERWARERVASQRAGHLNLYDVPATEWPMFTCVFYLWATEAMANDDMEYARNAIEASKDLILDPVHHTWVRQHWGDDYWHTQNVFFRSLVIAGLTSYERLDGHGRYRAMLREQCDSLAGELDRSKFGVLEDYPGECYPIDVLAAIAWIKRADELLGIERGAFYERAKRGFAGAMLDERGLIPYTVNYLRGRQDEPSRGIGNSHVLISAPDLWPDESKAWYRQYEEYFWQERWWAAGFREYPKDYPNTDTWDVDAGPIVDGFSISGNAFAVAAARLNGRFDHAFTLSAQVLTACWPLPGGMQLGARAVSRSGGDHAPYLGEAGILYFFTQNPKPGTPIVTGGRIVGSVWLGLLFYLGSGGLILWWVVRDTRKAWRQRRG